MYCWRKTTLIIVCYDVIINDTRKADQGFKGDIKMDKVEKVFAVVSKYKVAILVVTVAVLGAVVLLQC